jgi:probable phosphoglycerate mutase
VKPNRDRIAVFSHAGFALTWLSVLLEIPVTLVWSGFFLPPSSVTTILFEERSADWVVPRCTGLGDVSHLYAAGLAVGTVGLEGNLA